MGWYLRVALVGGIVLGFLTYFFLFSAPSSFPKELLLPVHGGETGAEIAQALKIDRAIRSELAFRILLRLAGPNLHIVAGSYYFSHPQNAFTIAWRLQVGNFDIEPAKVTIPEGTDVAGIDALLGKALPTFDSQTFLALAQPREGYLFPDTYFLYPGESMTEIVQTMQDNFSTHIADPRVRKVLDASGKSQSDVVIMASLLEGEAADTENRQIISGILWKRLEIGMPLQVDVDRDTYTRAGLPSAPITNPGIDSILAAATPTTTPYLYYLSDKQGNFHYSTTYAQQMANQKKYLK